MYLVYMYMYMYARLLMYISNDHTHCMKRLIMIPTYMYQDHAHYTHFFPSSNKRLKSQIRQQWFLLLNQNKNNKDTIIYLLILTNSIQSIYNKFKLVLTDEFP